MSNRNYGMCSNDIIALAILIIIIALLGTGVSCR